MGDKHYLYVHNCSPAISESELRAIFGCIGHVESLRRQFDAQHNTFHWLVEYVDEQKVATAIDALQGYELLGIPLQLCSSQRSPIPVELAPTSAEPAIPSSAKLKIVGLHYLDEQMRTFLDLDLKDHIQRNEARIIELTQQLQNFDPVPAHRVPFLSANCVTLHKVSNEITREALESAIGSLWRDSMYAIECPCDDPMSRHWLIDLGNTANVKKIIQCQVLRLRDNPPTSALLRLPIESEVKYARSQVYPEENASSEYTAFAKAQKSESLASINEGGKMTAHLINAKSAEENLSTRERTSEITEGAVVLDDAHIKKGSSSLPRYNQPLRSSASTSRDKKAYEAYHYSASTYKRKTSLSSEELSPLSQNQMNRSHSRSPRRRSPRRHDQRSYSPRRRSPRKREHRSRTPRNRSPRKHSSRDRSSCSRNSNRYSYHRRSRSRTPPRRYSRHSRSPTRKISSGSKYRSPTPTKRSRQRHYERVSSRHNTHGKSY